MTTSLASAVVFSASFAALYAAHWVADYWVQTNHQAQRKGKPGWQGRLACLRHVLTYTLTQGLFLTGVITVTDLALPAVGVLTALTVSGATHYWADRRTTLEWLARLLEPLAGKGDFYRFGSGLATGAWALDQSFHVFLSVYVPALIVAAMA